MIKKITFPENYDLPVEKESQRRFKTKWIKPTKHDREKEPYEMFYLFPKNLVIELNSGVNIIVGENGSGKSTFISLIKNYVGKPLDNLSRHFSKYKDEEDHHAHYQDDYNGYIKVDGKVTYKNTIFFNGEEDNPITAIPKMINPSKGNFISLSAQLFFSQEESHGESMIPVLDYILNEAKGGYTIFMDEPETALSLKNQIKLAHQIKRSAEEYGNQLIISTHSLAIIQEFFTIFDMETRKWGKREKYVKEIYK